MSLAPRLVVPVALALACVAASGCPEDVNIAGKRCDGTHACVDGYQCVADHCVVAIAEGEGEGAPGEGEGAPGEGEGVVGEGEGEGAEGEGEGGEGEGEGEGGEGEGEGGEGEGEGEGGGEGEGEGGVVCVGNGDDEDGDGIDDNCDNCPADFNDQQDDTDGDGVGDVCDPNPGTPGDSIVFFDAFNEAALAPAWIDVTGANTGTDGYILDSGALKHLSTTSGDLIVRTDVDTSNSVVEVKVLYEVAGTGFSQVGVLTGVTSTNPVTGLDCRAAHSGNDSVSFGEILNGSFQNPPGPIDAHPLATTAVGRSFTLVAAVEPARTTCTLFDDDVTAVDSNAPVAGGFGLRVVNANADIQSITVYRVGP